MIDVSALVQLLMQVIVSGIVLFVGRLVWKTHERVARQSAQLARIDVTLHGEKGTTGLSERVTKIGDRLHRVENVATGNTLTIEDHGARIKALEDWRLHSKERT
jgi:hypothetical protein